MAIAQPRPVEKSRPTLPLVAAAWGVGCWWGTNGQGVAFPAGLAVTAVVIAVRSRGLVSVLAATLAILSAGVGAGAVAALPPAAAVLTDHPRGLRGPWRVKGRLATDPQSAAPNALVDLAVEEVFVDRAWRPWPMRTRTTVYESPPADWSAGDRFEAFLPLRADRQPANPRVPPRQPLRASGADLRSSLKSFSQLRRRDRSPLPTLTELLSPARRWVRGTADRLFGGDAPFIKALLLGERGDIAPQTRHQFARTGLIHLLAISGLHVSIVVGALFLAGRGCGLASPRAALLCLCALPLVSAFVVPRPAVSRAVLMAGAVLLAVLRGRRPDALNGLAIASIILTAVDPWVTRDLGFQLSTGATAAILVSAGGSSRRGFGPALAAALTVSTAAQLGVAPLLAATSFRLPAAALLLNPIAVPLLALVLATGLAAMGAVTVGAESIAGILSTSASLGLDGLRALSSAGDRLTSAYTVPANAVTWICAITLATMIGLGCARRAVPDGAWSRLLVLLASLLATRAVAALVPAEEHRGQGENTSTRLTVFDIGQGDSLLVETPSGESVVIDTGGSPASSFDPGVSILAPTLRAGGIGHLDAVAITHFHADHAGGLAGLLGEIATRRIWTGSVSIETPAVRRLLATVRDGTVVGLAAGHRRSTGSCTWNVLHPSGEFLVAGGAPPANDASLVLQLLCGGRQVLLTGDAESASERVWAPAAISGPGVLKVPHHGSTTSTSEPLLTALEARHAVISVGWRNRFGLPSAEVLERYRGRGIAVYRTDRDGALTFSIGRRIRVRGERWTSGRGRYVVGGWLP